MGRITLKVTFGGTDNFRTEDVSFEVVPFKSAYHTIFGRPAFAKFMARPCYIYSKLKMSGPNGIITVQGDFKKAKECEATNVVYAEEEISREELENLNTLQNNAVSVLYMSIGLRMCHRCHVEPDF